MIPWLKKLIFKKSNTLDGDKISTNFMTANFSQLSIRWLIFDGLALVGLLLCISLVLIQSQPETHQAFKPILRALGGDHLLHVLVGAMLPLGLLLLTRLWRRSTRMQLGFFSLFPLAYASDELAQAMMPHRSSNWADLAFSLAGYATVVVGWLIFQQLKLRRQRSTFRTST
jgi:VanZ family protein